MVGKIDTRPRRRAVIPPQGANTGQQLGELAKEGSNQVFQAQ
jgi:hypothetical protein